MAKYVLRVSFSERLVSDLRVRGKTYDGRIESLTKANDGVAPDMLSDMVTTGLLLRLSKRKPAVFIVRDRRKALKIDTEHRLGDVTNTTLEEARRLCDLVREKIDAGQEPSVIKRWLERQIEAPENHEIRNPVKKGRGEWTFKEAVEAYVEFRSEERTDLNGTTWKKLKKDSRAEYVSRATGHAVKHFIPHDTPVSEITTQHLIDIVEKPYPVDRGIPDRTINAAKGHRINVRYYVVVILEWAKGQGQPINIGNLAPFKKQHAHKAKKKKLDSDVRGRLQNAWERIRQENSMGLSEKAMAATLLFLGGGPRIAGIQSMRRCELEDLPMEQTRAFDIPSRGNQWGLWKPEVMGDPDFEAIKQNAQGRVAARPYAFPIPPEAYALLKDHIKHSGGDGVVAGFKRWAFEVGFTTTKRKRGIGREHRADQSNRAYKKQTLQEIYENGAAEGRRSTVVMTQELRQMTTFSHSEIRKFFPTAMLNVARAKQRMGIYYGAQEIMTHSHVDVQRESGKRDITLTHYVTDDEYAVSYDAIMALSYWRMILLGLYDIPDSATRDTADADREEFLRDMKSRGGLGFE